MISYQIVDSDIRDKITGESDVTSLTTPQFVKAGAGAGKTTSITERVKNLIKKLDKDPENMVIITYTTKAANELLTRIREVLEKEKYEDIEKLNSAKISTFHAFCYELLREYPIEFCVDPSSELLDEKATRIMLENTFEKMVTLAHEDGEEFRVEKDVLNNFLNENSECESNLLKTLLGFYQNRDLNPYEIDTSSLRDISHINSEIEYIVKLSYTTIKDLYASLIPGTEDDKLYRHLSDNVINLVNDLTESEFVDYIINNGRWDLYKSVGNKGNFSKPDLMSIYKKEICSPIKKLSAYRDNLKKIEAYNSSLVIYNLFKELIDQYKTQYGVIDFFDCLYLVKTRLDKDKDLRKLVQDRFDVVIIDEFQDSDPLQADIAFRLAGEDTGKLFFVGDPKQSIYGFSRADISVYLEIMKRVEELDSGEVLELETNFRSSGGIIDFINENFSTILSDLDYKDMVPNPEKTNSSFSTEKWTLNLVLPDEEKKPGVLITRPREAFMVASEVKDMIDNHGSKPEDFLILFKTSTSMEEYEKALNRLDIPVINTKSKNFLSNFTVLDMLNLLSLCAFPENDFYKYAIETSTLFSFKKSVIDEVLNKGISFILKFNELFSISGLIEISLNNPKRDYISLKENLLSLVNSELVSNNYNLNLTFSRLHDKAVNDSWNPEDDLVDEALYIESTKPTAVRLMTIHASKGLEAKNVILVAHDAKPFAVNQYVDREKEEIVLKSSFNSKSIAETLDLTDLKEKYEIAEQLRDAEDKRVLYVALTRAEERIIIIQREHVAPKDFLNTLLNENPNFSEGRYFKIEDCLEEYENSFKHSTLKSSSINEGAINLSLINKERDVSRAVTTIIKDKDIFQNVSGRKNGLEFGVFVHKVMENLCNILFINKSVDLDITNLLYKTYELSECSLSNENLKEIKDMLSIFLKSPLVSEIISADSIQTELFFHSSDNYHGIIDLIIEKDNWIKIIDFKSDIPGDNFQEIKSHYQKQLDYYLRAIKNNDTGKEIIGECIYLFKGEE